MNKDKVKEIKAFLVSKVNPTGGKKDEILENVKEVIGDTDKFTVEYSSDIVDATVVTNKVNQTQNYLPPNAWVVITR